MEMMREAIGKFQNGKVGGADGVQAEFLKATSDEHLEVLLELLDQRLRAEADRPQSWRTPPCILIPRSCRQYG